MPEENCCIEKCEEVRVVGQVACKDHWDICCKIGNELGQKIAQEKIMEVGGVDVDWNQIAAQYTIPLGCEFPLGKVKCRVVRIKPRSLLIQPVSKEMIFKKAQKGEHLARLSVIDA